jgi:hypothetical protein
MRPKPWLVAPLAALALIAAVPQAIAAFTAVTGNGTSAFSSAASFPTYPAQAVGDGAQFYHRSDDAASFTTGATAADSSGNNRPGAYTGMTDGPSTWYRFDEGSGTVAGDASGAANAGTLVNGPTWAGGHNGAAGLTFDGTNDHVTAPAAAVDTSASFTVSAWAYLGASDPGVDRTVLGQDGTNVSAFFLKYDPTLARWLIHVRSSDSTASASYEALSGTAPVLNRWTHLTVVYDDLNDIIRFYVDGELNDTVAVTTDWSGTGPLIVGSGLWNGTRGSYWKGGIDEVRTFRRALSSGEVSQVFGKPTTTWNFDAVTYTQTDFSGNGNTGTVVGGAGFGANSVILDGTDDYVTGASSGMRTDRSFTVAAWVYPTTTTGLRNVASRPGTAGSAFSLAANGTAWQFTVTGTDAAAPATTVAAATTAVAANTLTHIVGVYSDEGDEVRIYVNGKREDSEVGRTTDWDATGVLNVGRALANSTYGGYFLGRVDDVKVYDHALSNDDVFSLWSAPLARYDFDENSIATAQDSSGWNRTATRPSGATTWTPSSHRGGAMGFNGTGYLTTAAGVVDTSSSYSVSAWVNLAAAGTNKVALAQDATNTSPFQLMYYNAGGENTWAFVIRPSDSTAVGQAALSSVTAATSRWTHLVGVYDDGADQVRIYVNGTLTGSASATVDFASSGSMLLGVGRYGGSLGTVWNGSLDEVTAYQSVLSAPDVSTLYHQSPHLRYDLNENAGTTAGDRSGNTSSGTMANGTAWAAGKESTALSFDGTDDTVTATAPVRTDTSFTVSAWVYLGATGATRTAVSQSGTTSFGYALGYNGTRWSVQMTSADGMSPTVYAANSTTVPATSTWTHLSGVYDDDSDRLRLYVNGSVEASTTVATDWNATGSFVLGNARWNGAQTYYFNGRVDEVYVHQRALRDNEVQDLVGFVSRTPAAAQLHVATASARQPGALQGGQQGEASSTAVAFNGASLAYNPISYVNPATFTIEAWFRASGTAGGTIAGFTTSTTSMSSAADRMIYLDSGGQVTFGVSPGGTKTTIRSPLAYNDGSWHHVAASLGASGMKLYLDGVLVSSGATTTALTATGYWRWGGLSLAGWANQPTSDHLVGTIDELAIYPTQLTDNKVARHYAANH